MFKTRIIVFKTIVFFFSNCFFYVYADAAINSPFTSSIPHLFDIKQDKPKLTEVVDDAKTINLERANSSSLNQIQLKNSTFIDLLFKKKLNKHRYKIELNSVLRKLKNTKKIIDPCLQKIKNKKSLNIECEDRYLGHQLAPKLVLIGKENGLPFLISKYQVSQRDYSLYCAFTGKCSGIKIIKIKSDELRNDSSMPEIGIDLSDVEDSISEYNKYCILTGKCPGVFADQKGKSINNITIEKAQSYAKWLSKVTSFNYRLPTEKEWLTVFNNASIDACQEHDSLNTKIPDNIKDKLINIQTKDGVVFSPIQKAEFTLKSLFSPVGMIIGPIEYKNGGDCSLKQQEVESSNFSNKQIGFHLVREFKFN